MKKIAFILFSLTAIGAAQAGTVLGSANNYTITGGAQGICSLLNENVKIALSSNVQGGYDCASGSSPTGIAIATCHTGGRTASRAYTCTAADVTAEVAGCTEAGTSITKSGPVVAVASSLAPSVSSYFPGSGTCDTGGATAAGAATTKMTADQTAAAD